MVEKRETAREGLFRRREMIKFGVMDTKQDRTGSNDHPDGAVDNQGQPLSLHQRILGDVEGASSPENGRRATEFHSNTN